jgi:mycothiol synthase
MWREGAVADDDRAARRAGLEIDRELHQMRVQLPLAGDPTAEFPPDVTLRTFVRGRDDAGWLALNNEAFAGHAEQGGWDLDTFRSRQREPWFDPEWLLVAERHGDLVGFNWLRRHPATAKQPETGEIYVIGVAQSERGRGLGKALALAGLDHLLGAGVGAAMLYVAADNAGAIGLYHSLGFEVTRTDRAYVAVVAPAEG